MDEKLHGTVKWFNTNKGFGFILSDDGREVFVHYTEIQHEGFRNLSEGEKVTFNIADTGKGLRAVNVEKSE
jgi:CspA family cold shock protein